MIWKNALIGFGITVFFSLLDILGAFGHLENQVYDFFLRFRHRSEKIADIVFLDVDDNAIAHNGVFPWPRSVTADGLLRLKEYGAKAAIFDIEFIDKGPQGVDTVYLNQGLPVDFGRSFSEINSAATDVFSALKSGRLGLGNVDEYALALSNFIGSERDGLLARAQGVARDNDLYLIRSSALFGKSWVSLNLRSVPLSGEQAERRSIAEEHFAYPVRAAASAFGGKFIDILPPLPGFALAAEGAGFTNVEIDKDGIRRRIYLAQSIHDKWYLQLAFAPLVDYLGNPEIELDSRRLVMRGAKLPSGEKRDITIPLDGQSRMMLDWPSEDFLDSYDHVSFADFSLLEELEVDIERFSRAFSTADIHFFAQFDSFLARMPFVIEEIEKLFDTIHAAKADALENRSDESFITLVQHRVLARGLIREILAMNPGARVNALIPDLLEAFPGDAGAIQEEAAYITTLDNYLRVSMEKYGTLKTNIENKVRNKFCILGRVDTGTSDIGSTPFHSEYVNVGTHGVVLDMILSESFITPIGKQWRVPVAICFVLIFLLVSSLLPPVPRVVSGFLVTGLVIASTAFLFRFTGVFLSPLITVISTVISVIIREIIAYAGSEQEKEFIRKAFSTYVSDEVVKEILANPSRLQLGGTKHHMSAIFTDLKGFSTISERLDPERVVSLLNRYLSAMSDVILEEKGTIDKYEGDAIIAFFGAPVELPDHALRACLSAITMKRIEKDLNETIMAEGLSPLPLLTRIGINTGSMVAGNMGTGNKMNYTIMGNAVNLASRLEGANKQYGTWILASDETVRETGDRILVRRIDRIRAVGIDEPVRIYELINTMEDAGPSEKKLVEVFHEALDFYENRRWKEAAEGFLESLSLDDSDASEMYLRLCKTFIKDPPPADWDGVNSLREK